VAARANRFGLPDAWAQSSLAEIRFSQMLPNLIGETSVAQVF
jgi:hypothetical protein